jgi:hypothetical protein
MVRLLPHQFKAISEILRNGLASIQEAIQEQIRTIHDASETSNQTQKEIPARLSELRIPANERTETNAYRKKQHRQQVWLTWGTWLAFIAASFYGGVAALQLRTLNRTYKEIQGQTAAAQCTAKAAQKQATLMQQQLEGTMAAILFIESIQETESPCCKLEIPITNGGHVIAKDVTVSGTATIYNGQNGKVIKSYPIFLPKQPLRPNDPEHGGGQIIVPIEMPFSDETKTSIGRFDFYIRFEVSLNYDNGFGEVESTSRCEVYMASGFRAGGPGKGVPPFPDARLWECSDFARNKAEYFRLKGLAEAEHRNGVEN